MNFTDNVLQVILNGLLLGGLYTCVGLGFSLVWGVMNIINLTHGVLIMLGAYATYWICEFLPVDPFLTVPMSMILLFCFGYLLQRYIFNLVALAPIFITLILTFGVGLALENLALYFWTANVRSVTTPYSGSSFAVGNLIIPFGRLIIFFIAVSLTVLFFFFMSRTKTGRAITATRMDRDAAKLMGVQIGRIYALTFGIGAAMAGASGSLISMVQGFSPVLGGIYLGKAFVICVLGGLGSMPAVLVGALVLGLVESLSSAIFGPQPKEMIAFILLVLILVIRPSGIMGKAFYEI
jgi:branched-chain amino acid transport system permease protein